MLLTRIFSVTLWYHFAFMAISVAMFGLSCGALIVHLKPTLFSKENATHGLSFCSWLFSASMLLSVLAHTLVQELLRSLPLSTAWSMYALLTFPLMAVPFIFSGIVVTIALTKFPAQASGLYAADLFGASVGCLLLAGLLSMTDCFTAIVAVAASGSAAAFYFSLSDVGSKGKRLGLLASTSCALMLLLACTQLVLAKQNYPLMKLNFVKGSIETGLSFEKWNSFSRIRISGDPTSYTEPAGWGLSSVCNRNKRIRQLFLDIDGAASTVLTAFDGDRNKIQHLRFDVTNVGHYLRPDANVLVIGVGGGRDLLSALAFDQKSVTGVEINQDIINSVMNRFGDFTGHIDRIPGVRIVNDEARSYVSRSNEKYDIIQVSLIDTWAASAAGGLSLSENSLYTLESWKIFLDHLRPDGILSFSRWSGEPPAEVYKLLVLANKALHAIGVDDPRSHIIVVKCHTKSNPLVPPVATMLVSKTAFSADDLRKIEETCRELNFEILLSPSLSQQSVLASLVSNPDAMMDSLDVNAAAPLDDRPYFFQMLPLKKLAASLLDWKAMNVAGNAIIVLFWLLALVFVLSLVCIFWPLFSSSSRLKAKSYAGQLAPLLGYFVSIGLAFMLIEIAQMQRLSVFLGHPSYSLTVILFSLLVSGGVGSLVSTKKLQVLDERWRLSALVLVVAATGFIVQPLCNVFQTQETAIRIVLAAMLTMPMGFFMGMAFPLGLRLAADLDEELGPWLWGLNGASAVCASVVSVLLSLIFGISTAFFAGVFFYLVAVLLYFRVRRV